MANTEVERLTDLDVLQAAAAIQLSRPALTAMDWRILGLILNQPKQEMRLADIRKRVSDFGTTSTFLPALTRLEREGLLRRTRIAHNQVLYTYTGAPFVPQPTQSPQEFVL